MDERRSSVRIDTSLVGRIVPDKRRAPIECVVRDLSDDGARIDVREEALLPYEFELEVPEMSLSVRSRVAWANGKGYGLMFISTPQIARDQSSSSQAPTSTPLSEDYTKSLSLQLSEAQYERMRRFAFERRISYQELMERALRAYLNQ
jgi:hypothetical protein